VNVWRENACYKHNSASKRANDHRQELNWGAAGGEGAAAEDPKPGDC